MEVPELLELPELELPLPPREKLGEIWGGFWQKVGKFGRKWGKILEIWEVWEENWAKSGKKIGEIVGKIWEFWRVFEGIFGEKWGKLWKIRKIGKNVKENGKKWEKMRKIREN